MSFSIAASVSTSPAPSALMMLSRLLTPGLFSGSKRISPSESVTARLILRRIVSASSSREMNVSSGSDLDIFFVGSCRLIIFAPTFGIYPSGIVKTSP